MDGMVRFSACAVDVARRVVLRDDVERHLEPQAFDLLAYLLAHRDRVVAKSELLDEVWGDQFVSESALTTRIKEIRQALGDDGARQAVVKNFRGRGYRFVAEVAEHDLSTSSPAPRVVVPAKTGLMGRDDDIADVLRLFESTRLVTLVGPGGVGKTSLAREIAQRFGEQRSDGVKVVQLAAVRDAQTVVHAIRRDTGLTEVGDDEHDLIDALADLDAVVVVDNCEHLLQEASRLVDAILRAGGGVWLLATSRERLGIPNEQVRPVAPLADEPARRLLLERSRSVQPDYEWSVEEEESVSRLLSTLDRLPLAIEMAAARLPSIGATDLASLLGGRLDLLRSANRTADDRHRTVRTLVSWSENLLDESERDLLSSLTVFAGAVSVRDIADVVGSDPSELAVGPLAGLVDKSLVVADTDASPTQYSLLETVRVTAAPRRSVSVESQHAHHIARVVSSADVALRTPDEASAAQRVNGLFAEVRIAHQWARSNEPDLAAELTAALIRYAHNRQLTEPASWARALLDDHGEDAAVTLSASASIAADAANRGDYELAARHAARAATSDDSRLVFSAHDTMADIGLYTGDFDATQHHGSMLVALGDRIDDPTARVAGAVSIVLGLVYSGQLAEANEALRRFDSERSLAPTDEAWIAYGRGEVFAATGDVAEAVEQFDRVVQLAMSVGSSLAVSVAQISALAVQARTGDVDDAMAAFIPVLKQYRRTRSFTHAITGLRNLVELLARAGHHDPAMVLFGALSNPDVKTTYGIESDNLQAARETATRHSDPAAVSSLIEQGSSNSVMWAIDHAIETLTEISATHAKQK
jgi:predicted ATPase/DNA-binding winged helix-turn-helix (wHTH) protein